MEEITGPLSTGWDWPAPHQLHVTVAAAHIDLMNHTNNVVYQQWMEAVAWSHSRTVGLGPEAYQTCGYGMVVRRHEMDFLAATRLGDPLCLATWLLAVDRVSTQRVYQFRHQETGQTVFRGRTQLVCIEIASGRLKRMPPAFFSAYSGMVVPGTE